MASSQIDVSGAGARAIFAFMPFRSPFCSRTPVPWSWCAALSLMAFFSSCTPGGMSNGGKTPVDYQDPLHPQYMATPTVLNFPDTARVFLEDEDYAQFQDDLLGFLESNNENDFARHFGDYYIPETFENDSIFDMYVTMWGRWDSIGVSTRLDHWTLLYASPFYEGDVYDVSLAEIDLRHHVVFQKRWTGNYKNFGRTLGERYPGASISYMDTTYVDAAGDTVLRRHITAQTQRLLYAMRAHGKEGASDYIMWLNDGWQMVPAVVQVMDSAAVVDAQAHRDMHGTLPELPAVSGR